MRTILSLAFVIGMMTVLTSSAEAQCAGGCYGSGYGYGAGFFAANQFGPRFITPREQPPYFAQFPPVYYSGIVRRPYGVSPYAAPAGITPVEMSVPAPLTIKNPFYNKQVAPVSNETPDQPVVENGNQVTWQYNPYIESVVVSE